MFKTILVDDEETVLDGLKNHVEWKKHDIQIVGAFPNGREAFAFISRTPVDLIVTDVCTPYMDGIELSRRAREIYPKVKILFISGYADVKFLRDALKLDAVDYIFKSIDLDELDATLSRVVGMLDEEQKHELRFTQLEEQFNENLPLLRNNRLTMLLRENVETLEESVEDTVRDFRVLGIPLDDTMHYAVLVARLTNRWSVMGGMTERERMLFALQIQNICEETLAEFDSSICFKDRISEYILVVNGEGDDCESTFLSVAETLRVRLKERLGLEITIGISDRFSGILKVRAAYESACAAIGKRYLLDNNLPISVNKYEEVGDLKSARERAEKEIGGAVMSGDPEAVRRAAERALADMAALPGEEEQQNFFLYLLMLPANLLTNVDPAEKGSYASLRRLTERYLLCHTSAEQTALLLQSYAEVTAILARMSAPKPSAVIQKVTELIERRYMEHLSVSTLASEAFLSPTYLCVLFKQQTGKTVNEFITLERIRQAKRMLADPNILLYDVCYRVGYLSPSYFSKLFKKTTGQTPGEYRDEICPPRKDA